MIDSFSSPIEYFKKAAKGLLKQVAAREPTACTRLRAVFADLTEKSDADIATSLSLMRAQHVVAVEHGFPKWTELAGSSPVQMRLAITMATLPELNSFGMGLPWEDRKLPREQRIARLDEWRAELRKSVEYVEKTIGWLKQHVQPTATINRRHTSYGLKDLAEEDIDYITNGAFIAAAIIAGYPYKVHPDSPNVGFGMSEKSLSEWSRQRDERKKREQRNALGPRINYEYTHGCIVTDLDDLAFAARSMGRPDPRMTVAYCSSCDLFCNPEHFDGHTDGIRRERVRGKSKMRSVLEAHVVKARRERTERRSRRDAPDHPLASQNLFGGVYSTPLIPTVGHVDGAVASLKPTGNPDAARLDLVGVREAALQYHIDHCEERRVIVVDAATLATSSVLPPWHTTGDEATSQPAERRSLEYPNNRLPFDLPKLLYRKLQRANWSTRNGIQVLVIDNGACVAVTTILRRKLTEAEWIRFAVASAKASMLRDAQSKAPGRKGRSSDWYWQTMYPGGCSGSGHQVADADLAHEREADVRAAVAADKVPVLVTIGKKRAAALVVLDRPEAAVPFAKTAVEVLG